MFEQRRPSIIRDISCVGSAHTLLKEQGLEIPRFIRLLDIKDYVIDAFEEIPHITPEYIYTEDLIPLIRDLRCWIKHFYEKEQLRELSKIKAMQSAVNLLLRIFKVAWRDYFYDPENDQEDDTFEDDEDNQGFMQIKAPSEERKLQYLELFKEILQLIDWLCLNNRFIFIFNEECGKTNLNFIINTCNRVLGQFRRPRKNPGKMPNLENLTYNKMQNKPE